MRIFGKLFRRGKDEKIPLKTVYRDEEYTTSWISHEHAKEIASYLNKEKK